MTLHYFIANKPYNTVCRFTPESDGQQTLAHLNFNLPKDVYPVGRLDIDSEGLLLLTNDKKLNHTLLNPQFAHERTYLSLVQDRPTDETLENCQKGLEIKIEKKWITTLPCKVNRVEDPSVFFNGKAVWERIPPPIPQAWKQTTWLEMVLIEGKYRQVRRMCAKMEHPCLRLIRVKIANLKLNDLQPNEVLELDRDYIYDRLGVDSHGL